MSQRIAVYPGSFDPVHNGHLDIIRRCRPIFDEVVVAVLHNVTKKPLFSVEERVEMIREAVGDRSGVRVESFSGLLVHFMAKIGAHTTVRGLRAVSDFESELQMAQMNHRLDAGVETVFLPPKVEYGYLSSRLIKEVYLLGGDLDGLVPAEVLERLRRRVEPA